MTEQARRPIIADPRQARGTFRSRALGLTALVASLGLVALGVPQAINALHMAAGEPLLLRLIYAEPRDQALAGLARHHFAIAAAWFDFSMQIPAVAIAYFALVGACAGQCVSAPYRDRRGRKRRGEPAQA